METHPEYLNTIFIFMADHVLRASASKPHDSFNIPLIIYSPGNLIPPQKITTVASQYDLLPTIASLVSIQDPIASFGKSLLTEQALQPHGALSKQGPNYIWFNNKSSTSFNAITGLNLTQNSQAQEHESNGKLSDLIKAKLQICSLHIKNNNWIPINSVR